MRGHATLGEAPRRPRRRCGIGLLALLAVAACERPIERVPEPYLPTTAHDAYGHGLQQAGLETSALGRDWLEAAEAALRQPLEVDSPFLETGWFDPAEAVAVGYRFDVTGGQRIEVDLDIDVDGPARVFVDLFRVEPGPDGPPVHVASAAGLKRSLQFETLRDATYLVRIQPELLRGGRFTLTIRNVASLEFPVAGLSVRSIQSVFGAPRDGGRRSHRGVDIFAPRGTPALAAADGVAYRVGQRDLGGNVVWIRTDSGGHRLYYAHLDSYSVERGQRVRAGEPIGRVGNTGNARTTPPHLHFGVYLRPGGAVDPTPFIRQVDATPDEVGVDLAALGTWARSSRDDVDLRSGPGRRSPPLVRLGRDVPMRLVAASGGRYRVRLPDGTMGWVFGDSVEPVNGELDRAELTTAGSVRTSPRADAPVVDEIAPGSRVPILGRFGTWVWVSTPAGLNGWLEFEE